MILRLNTILLILFVLVFSSCSDTPIACFENDSDTIEINKSILFTNCSTNSDQYEWDFGDSVVSTDSHPKHSYSDTGAFNVKLIAFSDFQGNSDYIEKEIIVTNPSDKFIGNYLFQWENNDALLSINQGLTVGSIILLIDGQVFCNAYTEGNNIQIDSQNYWDDDFDIISHGLGSLQDGNLEINIIVIDNDSNESIIHISAEKLSI